ncbi:uncharacterized protein B0T15DRAFT_482486 [Chaetomium strumarium]|uniref:Uncharacterized protein n=1 Tax=Chaetomium strumarium TaxID=1170767 RepID=A0AAJ0H499_9PEZI|nr:hypothetical protein B0T15DRAFT_482486 [Chaetomium strumarium]
MASAHHRKRSRADDLLQEHRPNKIKSRGRLSGPSNFPPEFWDNLSKVWLTPRALRELDRRNSTRPTPELATPAVYTTDLARRSSAFSGSRRTQSTRSTKATSLSAKSGKSSAYGHEFETHLTDHGIYPEGYEYPEDRSTPEPGNQVHQDLSSKFRDFKRKDARATFENDVMATVVPIICGDVDIPSRQNVLFTELAPLTSTYDEVHASVPVAPNFFLEAKAPKGAADVLKRQACYDGAYGARFDMTDSRETFVQGATAFRNARDLAQRYRDQLIQAANAKARQSNTEAPPEAEVRVAIAEHYEDSTADEFVDCEEYASQVVGIENHPAFGDADEALAPPQYLYAEDEEPSQESTSLGAEPAMSFATSFTLSFIQSQTSSKRTRASHSPPSNSRPRKKLDRAERQAHRSAPRRSAGSSAQGSTSSGSAGLPPASASSPPCQTAAYSPPP